MFYNQYINILVYRNLLKLIKCLLIGKIYYRFIVIITLSVVKKKIITIIFVFILHLKFVNIEVNRQLL